MVLHRTVSAVFASAVLFVAITGTGHAAGHNPSAAARRIDLSSKWSFGHQTWCYWHPYACHYRSG